MAGKTCSIVFQEDEAFPQIASLNVKKLQLQAPAS